MECTSILMYNVKMTGPWQSGLMRRTYNPVKRVSARSVSPNLTGPATMVAWVLYESRKTEIRFAFRETFKRKTRAAQENKDTRQARSQDSDT
jgi:hypothetical protein